MQAYQFQWRRLRAERKNDVFLNFSLNLEMEWSPLSVLTSNQSCIDFLIETKFCQKGFAANLDGE